MNSLLSSSLALVVPLYNEKERVLTSAWPLVRFIVEKGGGSELVWVDDGSTDGTAEIVASFLRDNPGLPARLVRRPHEGKGAAIQAAIETCTTAYAGFCDVDLSTPLADLDRVFAAACLDDVLAIGSRALEASRIVRHQSRRREVLGRAFNRLVRGTLTPGISDTQCGAKVATLEAWERILPHCYEKGFAWDVEVIAVALRLGVRLREVAVSWSHEDRSKVRVMRDGIRMVTSLWSIHDRVTALGAEHAQASVDQLRARRVAVRELRYATNRPQEGPSEAVL